MNLRWWIFTKPEQDQIRKIFDRRGERAAAAYCREIGKSWSASSISKFFQKERAAAGVSGGSKLRPDSRLWKFTKTERNEIREIFERHGERPAAVYCRKIGKSWSASSISRFFHNERATAGMSCGLSLLQVFRWRQFTEPERHKLREIFDRRGERAAAAHCRKIGKSWSIASICRFFSKERAVIAAQEAEIRKDAIRSMALFEAHIDERMRRGMRRR